MLTKANASQRGWSVTDVIDNMADKYSSSRHSLRVSKWYNGKWVIITQFGQIVRGPNNKQRIFKTASAAIRAADQTAEENRMVPC